MKWFAEPFQLLQIATLVQSDTSPPDPTDATYLFTHTPDNEESILRAGAELYLSRRTNSLITLGGRYTPPGESEPILSGFEAWRKWLGCHGVPANDIRVIPLPSGLVHSGIEAKLFVEFAIKEGWKTVHIVAHPLHIVRAYTHIVTQIIRSANPVLWAYAKAGAPQPWHKQSKGGQGKPSGTRIEGVLRGEYERLEKYFQQDDIVSAQRVIQYHYWRDKK